MGAHYIPRAKSGLPPHLTTAALVELLEAAGAPLTTLEVLARVPWAKAANVGSMLSRMAAYGTIRSERIAEASHGGVGLTRSYCLWSAKAAGESGARSVLTGSTSDRAPFCEQGAQPANP